MPGRSPGFPELLSHFPPRSVIPPRVSARTAARRLSSRAVHGAEGASRMDRSAKLARIKARTWYHSIEVEPGLVTPGTLTPEILRANLDHVRMPARLDGLTILDIGAW